MRLVYADFVQRANLTPDSVRAAWIVIYASLGKLRPSLEIVGSLEKIRVIAPKSGTAQLCQGIALGLQDSYSDGITQLEQPIQSGKSVQDAYF